MVVVKQIKECDVNQGDLVFIRHIQKSYKTGWYRKVRTQDVIKGETSYNKVCYVLEIPVHKDFNANSNDGSRREQDTYLMMDSSVREYGAGDSKYAKTDFRRIDKYEILACLKGISSVILPGKLIKQNCSLPFKDWIADSRSIVTTNFRNMIDKYHKEVKQDAYEELVEEFI